MVSQTPFERALSVGLGVPARVVANRSKGTVSIAHGLYTPEYRVEQFSAGQIRTAAAALTADAAILVKLADLLDSENAKPPGWD